MDFIRQHVKFSHYHEVFVFYQSFLCAVVALYARCFIAHYIREIDGISLFLAVWQKPFRKPYLSWISTLGINSSDLFSILLAENLCGIAEIKQHKCFVLKEYNSWIENYKQTKIKVLVKKKKSQNFLRHQPVLL